MREPGPCTKKGRSMKNLYKQLVSLIVLSLSLGALTPASAWKMPDILSKKMNAPAPDQSSESVDTADKGETPFYLPSYVKQHQVPAGIFETEGYITFVYNPYNGQMHQRLIIVHEQKNGPENTAIRIRIKDADGLQKGDHYRFTIKAGSEKMNPQSTQQVLELVDFTPLDQDQK